MPDYLLNAADCPALMTPVALLNPAGGTPITADTVISGVTTVLSLPFNANAARLDVLGRYGGGAYAIVEGLEASTQTGLTLTLTAGQAMLDGPVTLAAAETVALTDNATNYVWFTQSGNLVVVVGATTPPPGVDAAVFLCRVVTAAGVQGTPDYSGRYELRGGTLYRRTGDAGTPADTPPSTVQFLAQTAGGRYWWDGSAYTKLDRQGVAVADLTQTISNPPTQAEVQAIQDTVNALLASLRTAGLIAT